MLSLYVKVVIVAIVFLSPFPPCFDMGSAGLDMCFYHKSLGFFNLVFTFSYPGMCVCGGGGYIIVMRIRPSVKRTGVSPPGFSLSVDASRQKGKKRDKEDREKMVFWVDGGWGVAFGF